MASKKIKNLLLEGKIDEVRSILEKYKPQSEITTRYAIVRFLKKNKLPFEQFEVKPEELVDFKKERNDVVKTNIDVPLSLVEDILKDRFNSKTKITSKDDYFKFLTYVLLVSGRRISEILENDYKVEDGVFKIVLNKKANSLKFNDIFIIDKINTKTLGKMIKLLRKNNTYANNKSLNSNFKKYLVERFGELMSSHVLRGIYANYAYLKFNDENIGKGFFIKNILNHENTRSAANYDYINLI